MTIVCYNTRAYLTITVLATGVTTIYQWYQICFGSYPLLTHVLFSQVRKAALKKLLDEEMAQYTRELSACGKTFYKPRI